MSENIDPMKIAQTLVTGLLALTRNHFLLTWEGYKIPTGAKLDGINIGWTQHGMITGTNREDLGYYKRVEEFGGESRKRHVMLIGTEKSTLTPPEGGSVISVPKQENTSKPEGFHFRF